MSTQASEYIITQIRQENLITDFLDKKGIVCSHQYKEKSIYVCPLHKDSQPSFIVYDKLGEYQNYYCFGCHASGDFLSIYSKLNNISYKEAISQLGGNIAISDDEELDFIIRTMKKEEKDASNDEGINEIFAEISLDISALGRQHFENTEKDEQEAFFLDRLYKKIDHHVFEQNISALCIIYDYLQDGDEQNPVSPFQTRLDAWTQKTENNLKLKLSTKA